MDTEETPCNDCGRDTLPFDRRSEWYVVSDTVWQEAGMKPAGGYLCIGCLEARLGRQLTPEDFPDVPVNDLSEADGRRAYTWRTPLLVARMTGQPFAQLTIDLDNVKTAYVGRAHTCACGCAGEYFYPSALADRGVELRGYAIGPEEVDDASVATIVRDIERIANREVDYGEIDMMGQGWISALCGEEMLMVHFLEPLSAEFIAAHRTKAREVVS